MSDLPNGGVPAADPDDEIEVDLEADEPEPDEPEEGDETEADEPDEGGDPEPIAATPPARRGSPRVQSLVNENRELKARQAQFERQLADLTAARNQPSQAEIAAQQEMERQRYELMSPFEQAQYLEQKINNRVQQQTNQIAAGLWDQNDQRDYAALLETTPAYKRYDDRVNELRTQAPGVSRRILLATAIGLRALEGGGAARTRATRQAEAGAARNVARPAGGRGDAPSERGRGDGGSARDARLRAAGLIP
mgnify:FL=1